jgi:hypothetical protein
MAVPTGTFQTFQSIGNREDLQDVIYDISPMDTPLMSNIERISADAVLHEWQTDALAAASATNAQIEGDDANVNTAVPTARFNNYTQIATKNPRVSGTQRAINTAGRADELSYQIAKRGRELKRDIERTICGTQVATAGGAASARQAAGLAGWLYTNQVKTADTQSTPALTAGHPSAAATAGTAIAFTEAHLQSAIALCWTAGGNPTLVLMDAVNKRTASAFSGIATQYRDNAGQAMPAVIIGSADVYVSDFGQHSLLASRFTETDIVYTIDPDQIAVAYLRPIQQQSLSKTGDSDRVLLLTEFTLCVREPEAHAKVYSTT